MSAMRPSDETTTTAADGLPDRREPGDRQIVRLHEMTAVILCGGMGTRLREETEFKPKPMVEIGGRPILWHIMKHYSHFGVRNFVLCLGYRGDAIRDYFLNYQIRSSDFAVDLRTGGIETLSNGAAEDWRVVLAETGADTLTGSRLRQVLPYLRTSSFFATYGDGLSDVDLDALLTHHRRSGRAATVTAVHPSSRYGELSIRGGLVKSFNEKPQVTEGWINGGFMVFERRAFDGLSAADNISLEVGVLEDLARRDELAVYQHDGFWQSMDTYREMCLLNELWTSGQAPWRIWERHRLSA
ncbi:glucose-1-phosphate cytidylyltransferase [Virgifigura deserti]|uniref:glucose-1-phosphate cytidylyltransferase n=1 Tax=Virgifigura deserti TaxID=2268457 RepID=UPI003CCC00A8